MNILGKIRTISNGYKTGHIEVNGPANISVFVDAMRLLGRISEADANLIKFEAEKTIQYIKQLNNPKHILWSDINL